MHVGGACPRHPHDYFISYIISGLVLPLGFFTQFLSQAIMYPENPEGTQVIVGSMNMGYISDTARNRTHNLFRLKREPIPLGHSLDGIYVWLHYT